jgi:hypothetical protein
MAATLLVFGGEFDTPWCAAEGAGPGGGQPGTGRFKGAVAKRQTRRPAKPLLEGSSPSRTSISEGRVIP